jgi:large subunit ribosomal protein L6
MFTFSIIKNKLHYMPLISSVGFNFFKTRSFHDIKFENQYLSILHIHLKQLLIGVSIGFKKFLRVRGVGYKFKLSLTTLTIQVGYSHLLKIKVPLFKSFILNKKATLVRGQGVNLSLLTTFFAATRFLRSPDVYKGKGIRYRKDSFHRKEGKKKKMI